MPKPLRFRQRLDRYPPILIRLLTTRGRGAGKWVPDDRQLAAAGGLTMAEFKFVSYSTKWEGSVMAYLDRYMLACDIDLEKRRCFRRLEWMRRHGNFSHLKKSALWESQFETMLNLWVEADGSS